MRKNEYKRLLKFWYKTLHRKDDFIDMVTPTSRRFTLETIEAVLFRLDDLPPFRQGQTVGDLTVTKVTTTDLPLVDVASGKPLPNCWSVGHEYQVTDGRTPRWVGERFLIKRQEATNG